MSDLLAARLQMAISLGFHIIFAAIGIAMPALMAVAHWRWLRTGDDSARRLTLSWAKGTAVFFAVGAVSGTVLSFELGLLWPRFMERAGGVIGLPFSLEGFAFFTEAIFLGIYLYGWDRINRWVHFASGIIVAVSGAASAAFVMMVNAWMNAPVGFEAPPGTDGPIPADPVKAMFSPAWPAQTVHMLVAGYGATALAAAGIHALAILRHGATPFHRFALAITMTVASAMAIVQPIVGHWAGQVVARTQPVKLAAMEGQWATEPRAPLRIGGWPDEQTQTTPYAIEVPGMLSWMAYGDSGAVVQGLSEVPPEDRPPVAWVHLSFQVMVACGMLMMAAGIWFVAAAARARALPTERNLLRAIACAAPIGFIAIEAGWIVTEVGRQPWSIAGVMRTREAVTPMPGLWVPMAAFTAIYLVLGGIVALVVVRQVRSAGPRGRPDPPAPGAIDAH